MVLSIQNLRKQFKDIIAVNDLNWEIEGGKIFGMIGPNGAGKTTTIKVILDILKPTSGNILLDGKERASDFLNICGYLPEERGLYKKSRVKDVLRYFARLKNIDYSEANKKTKYWLEQFNISKYAGKRIEELSKGNQQKVQFISAIIHNPKILILDEPFTGFDPVNQELIQGYMTEFVDDGNILILSTHMMEIAERLCDDILLIDHGKKILSGSLKQLKHELSEDTFKIVFDGEYDHIQSNKFVVAAIKKKDHTIIKLDRNIESSQFLKSVVDKINIIEFSSSVPSLSKIFIQSVKRD
ncbi:MAG: ATP-binding cassette domain-containing protein [Melioribacteraceae bacterium]|nr:ATP-binding cassette domain-containing protein [Melioribacteraceae bacterium]